MTAPGRYAASDGSFAKSAGGAAARGGILIGIAILIGFVLLWKGFDGGDADAALPDEGDNTPTTQPADESSAVGTSDGETPTTEAVEGDTPTTEPTTTEAVAVDDPSTVSVIILNGTGRGGFAGERGGALGALGYKWTAGNAAGVPVAVSNVFYTDGFADEAKAVAEALSGTAGVVEAAPPDPTTLATEAYAEDASGANVLVVLGADELLA